jgi:3',5'-cyclic AMP phosphodiesterase CpdA
MHEHFPLADGGKDVGDYRYSTAVGSLRLVACDTTVGGSDGGRLGAERLGWLAAELAAGPQAPTVIAMHHPPLLTGISDMDEIVLPRADREALAVLLAQNPQVRCVIAGHVHRAAFWTLGSCGVVTCPSTWLQAPLEIPGGRLRLVDEPAGFALHALLGDEFVSHIQPLS